MTLTKKILTILQIRFEITLMHSNKNTLKLYIYGMHDGISYFINYILYMSGKENTKTRAYLSLMIPPPFVSRSKNPSCLKWNIIKARYIDRQIDRQIERERGKQTETERERQRQRESDAERQSERKRKGQID